MPSIAIPRPMNSSDESNESSDGGRSYREMAAVLLAVVFDSVQIGTTVLTLGGDLVAVPAQVLFSCFASAVLMAVLGPHWQLLPAAALELAPGLNLLPTYTAGTMLVLRKRKKEQAALAASQAEA